MSKWFKVTDSDLINLDDVSHIKTSDLKRVSPFNFIEVKFKKSDKYQMFGFENESQRDKTFWLIAKIIRPNRGDS